MDGGADVQAVDGFEVVALPQLTTKLCLVRLYRWRMVARRQLLRCQFESNLRDPRPRLSDFRWTTDTKTVAWAEVYLGDAANALALPIARRTHSDPGFRDTVQSVSL